MTIDELLSYIRTEDDYNKAKQQVEMFIYNERSNAYDKGFNDGYVDCYVRHVDDSVSKDYLIKYMLDE